MDGNTGSAFIVDTNTGLIQVNGAIDYETKNSYTLTVQLEDQGTMPLASNTTVTINIEDVNDNPPTFFTSFNFQVDENSPVDTVIGQVTATDSDSGGNGDLVYSITSISNGNDNVFKVV